MISTNRSDHDSSKLRAVKAAIKRQFPALVLFSLLANLLLLASAIYMLQIYDRVITSGSLNTLIWLTVMALTAVVIYGLLEQARRLVLSRIGGWLDNELSGAVIERGMEARLARAASEAGPKDVAAIRTFVGGEALLAFLDAPWSVFFIAFIWLLHPALGVFATVGAAVLFAAALSNDLMTRRKQQAVDGKLRQNHEAALRFIEGGETIATLGMTKGLLSGWRRREAEARADQQALSETTTSILSFSRAIRLGLQIGILGLGAYYVLQADLTAGAMIAASIVMGRALAPIERSIGAWRRFTAARGALDNLNRLFANAEAKPEAVRLPVPQGRLTVEAAHYHVPGTSHNLLTNISFDLMPGDACAVIGPSGAGKSTLCRLLVGAWQPRQGHVRLDGADIHDWDAADLGPHIGYLPQQVELFPGTVAQNIARFGPLDSAKIVDACRLTGVHEMILGLPDGYESDVGLHGARISLGQKQRIGLARALYGDPAFVVLDEPNSNLDSAGEQALDDALAKLKQRGCTYVIVSHRLAVLDQVDKILMLRDGMVSRFGQRGESERRKTVTPSTSDPVRIVPPAGGKRKLQKAEKVATAATAVTQTASRPTGKEEPEIET